MTGAEYIVNKLMSYGVTDTFGIPGGVVLDLLYAMDAQSPLLTPHLLYHEQDAGFAACGYAQASGKLGVAYATRGPGFTNMITPIAEAYYDSLPVLFLTSHTTQTCPSAMRVMTDQELDTCSMVQKITKFASRVDIMEELVPILEKACNIALEGRKGPVFLDVSSKILSNDVPIVETKALEKESRSGIEDICIDIQRSIYKAKRPVILVGDGVNQVGKKSEFLQFIKHVRIPVISSRFSHSLAADSNLYFGYIGSHGIRTANCILSKADLIVAIGNRMNFPTNSITFSNAIGTARIIRIDIDSSEFIRKVPNATNYQLDISGLLDALAINDVQYGVHDEWLDICKTIKKELHHEDVNAVVKAISDVLKHISPETNVVCDVGNNEFWVSQAAVLSNTANRVLYSKSFGTLGCALGKAIGTYYVTKQPVLCFIGDQGLQMNIQELQYIAQHQLPIMIVLLNNHTSGMIKDKELHKGHYVHTTKESGYQTPNFEAIMMAYGIPRCMFIEIDIDENLTLTPNIPVGASCSDMIPRIDRKKFTYINSL